ncbi:MAG: hypothetical protein LH624_12890, partial [Cryobacterium sp.]|nr:hypothetical protein [Cryobacterium sp.]
MSSLGGRRRERGKTLLSPGAGPRIIREPAIDRLTADRLAGVLSLLSSGQPQVTQSKVAESEAAESQAPESEFAQHEFAEPDWAQPEQAEPEWAKAESATASPAQVISPPDGWVPELAARGHITAVVPVIEAALREAKIERKSVDAVAVTAGPGLAGSLLVGVNVAKALAYS